MQGRVHSIAVSLLVIAVGVAWLLNTMQIIPGVNWVWTIGLAASGLLILALGGFNKLTIVVGPFLVIASVSSLMRQQGRLPAEREVPLLVIALGALMLLSAMSSLPRPGERPV